MLHVHELREAMEKYPDSWGLKMVPDPGDCIPNTNGPYRADAFDQ